ncbi:glucosaminidase domain-containing protein [Fusobacterium sp. SB021]|uniref:glucosaminidase domain-containing protein n=1 Tax=Fusobacterium sp. SB021 TaxID=2744227 RepID=UPI003CEAB7AD
MKEIKIKKLERKRIEKNIFHFVFLLVVMLFTFSSCSAQQRIITEVKYDKIVVNSVEDIYQKRDGLFVFSDINIDLRKIPSEKRKDVFVKLLLPSIEVVQQEVLNNREIVKKLKVKKELTESEKIYAEKLFKKYKTEYGNWNELESKMIVYPASLILTQGAIESAWGTSRFFREANNAFGVWSTNPNEPRIAAKGSRGDFTPHLKKYDTLKDTVEDITLIISRSSAYTGARKMIWEGKSPYEIAGGLTKYSEEGKEYVKKVRSTLKYNNFHEYDNII